MSCKEIIFNLLDSSVANLGVYRYFLWRMRYIGENFHQPVVLKNTDPCFWSNEVLVEFQQFSAVDEMESAIAGMGFCVVSGNHEDVCARFLTFKL
ncbi:hypothetical protein ABIC33_002215 [Variovorax sp. 1140]|uniref:hypothetical protein n=1 Tax=Variovorax atrisoli TaxID=3394203 RepID=UPI003394AF60